MSITVVGRFALTVDGRAVPADAWQRRSAVALVKLLAVTGGHRLHREQAVDRIWPEEDLDVAVARLHKAAHFARKAVGFAGVVVLRDEQVLLCPDDDLDVDADAFDALATLALSSGQDDAVRRALDACAGELLPDDPYEPWAAEPRLRLRSRHLDLLRAAGRWETVVELEPTDEAASAELMLRLARAGNRQAALRQYERLAVTLHRELGVTPGPRATALRDRLLAEQGLAAARQDVVLVGRSRELRRAEEVLRAGRTLVVTGPAGVGKSALEAALAERAGRLGFQVGAGTAAPVEGAWPFAPLLEAVAQLCRPPSPVLETLDPGHRAEVERALGATALPWSGESTHTRFFVAVAELVRLAAASRGVMLVLDDAHLADEGSLRLLHYLARATRDRQPVCIVLVHRDEPVPPALAQVRRSLLEGQSAHELVLCPLDDTQAAGLVAELLPQASPQVVDRAVALARGLPFAVHLLVERAAGHPDPGQALAVLTPEMVTGLPEATHAVLQRVAVAARSFGTDEFVALSGLDEQAAFHELEVALSARVIEPTPSGYAFRHELLREALLGEVPEHRRRQIHRQAAENLTRLGASSARIAHHLLGAGAPEKGAPYLLDAARTEAALGAYRDALALLDSMPASAYGAQAPALLALRADLLNATGDALAVAGYRKALDAATGPRDVRHLRIAMARCAQLSGDTRTAVAALDGIEPDGGQEDADILLIRGKSAYYGADLATACQAAVDAEPLVLAGSRGWQALDLVALRGMVAHDSGRWFDQLRVELRRTREAPQIADAVFDGYLCPVEYLLYGPTPYAEVIEVGRGLQAAARGAGALRAVAFACALVGEAALLSGDLDLADRELSQARNVHHVVNSAAGEAHCLQRLAEVRLAQGDTGQAQALLHHALPLARGSMLAKHLLQRVFGTMIFTAEGADDVLAVADQAAAVLGWDDFCPFCSIMFEAPAAVALARAGLPRPARDHLAKARESAALWKGTAWQAWVAEARAHVALAEGDQAAGRRLLREAAGQFERAGQPIDVDRCRRALDAPDPLDLRDSPAQAGAAKISSAMLSGSRNDSPDP